MIGQDQQEARTAELLLVLQELEDPTLTKGELKSLGNRLKLIYLSESGDGVYCNYTEGSLIF